MAQSSPDDFSALIGWPREERNLEFKRSMAWLDPATKAKLTKSVLAMANVRDGGHIVLGVGRKADDTYEAVGMQPDHADSFVQDQLSAWFSEYADPYIEVTLTKRCIDQKIFCIIRVSEFAETPVVCKKGGAEGLRRGAMYTRSRRMVETVEVPSQVEMREILDLAVEKRHRAFLHQAHRMGLAQAAPASEFVEQLKRLPGTEIFQKIRSSAYWRFWIRPTIFEEARLQSAESCRWFVLNNAVLSDDGWRFPDISAERMREGPDYVTSEMDLTSGLSFPLPRVELWTMFRSGQFTYNLALAENFLGEASWPVHPQYWLPTQGKRYLNIGYTIRLVSCVFEFAARMANQKLLAPRATISIELCNVDGRELSFMTRERSLDERHWSRAKNIEIERSVDPEELSGNARGLALDVVLEILKRFGWENPPRALLAEDQARVLS